MNRRPRSREDGMITFRRKDKGRPVTHNAADVDRAVGTPRLSRRHDGRCPSHQRGLPATEPDGTPVPAASSPLSDYLTPAQIQKASGIDTLINAGCNGAGQTIAIIRAYNDPKIISDTAAFCTQFGLQQFNVTGGPTLTVLDENGNTISDQTGDPTSPPNAPTSGPNEFGTRKHEIEVEWAHVVTPQANIILFEASSFGNYAQTMMTAVNTAEKICRRFRGLNKLVLYR